MLFKQLNCILEISNLFPFLEIYPFFFKVKIVLYWTVYNNSKKKKYKIVKLKRNPFQNPEAKA